MAEHKEILNYALSLSCEFGPNLNQPINQRLLDKFPELKEVDLDKINSLCYSIRDEGHQHIYQALDKVASERKTIGRMELEISLKDHLSSKYLWISQENLARLYSQGCYYAWKDGLIEALGD